MSDLCSTKVAVITFAETATAIGIMAANMLAELKNNEVFIVTTTRGAVSEDAIYFLEQHSHAVEQKLNVSRLKEVLKHYDFLILLDDEMSTGNTTLNCIKQLKSDGIIPDSLSVEAWSFINCMSEPEQQLYFDEGIKLHHICQANRQDFVKSAGELPEDLCEFAFYGQSRFPYGRCDIVHYSVPADYSEVTLGVDAKEFCARLSENLSAAVKDLDLEGADIIGTEECMYPALVIASLFDGTTCHSTARNPILANNKSVLLDRLRTKSVYSHERDSYLYNITNGPETTVIVTNSENLDLIDDLAYAIMSVRQTAKIIILNLVREDALCV